MKDIIIGTLAVIGVVGAIGFAERELALASLSILLAVPYIIVKAQQPLEEEESC